MHEVRIRLYIWLIFIVLQDGVQTMDSGWLATSQRYTYMYMYLLVEQTVSNRHVPYAPCSFHLVCVHGQW